MTLALSAFVITAIQITVNCIPNIKLIGYTLKMQINDLLFNLISAVVMCVAVCLLGSLNIRPVLRLVLQVVSGMGIYLLISMVSRNDSFYYLLDCLKKYFRAQSGRAGDERAGEV